VVVDAVVALFVFVDDAGVCVVVDPATFGTTKLLAVRKGERNKYN
jgi:hypothetical protein